MMSAKRCRRRSRSPSAAPKWTADATDGGDKLSARTGFGKADDRVSGYGRPYKEYRPRVDWQPNPATQAETQETQQIEAWISRESEFLLGQSRKRAMIRMRDGRAKPSDRLCIYFRLLEAYEEDNLEDDEEMDVDVAPVMEIVQDLSIGELNSLLNDIGEFCRLEQMKGTRDFWKAVEYICQEKLADAQEPSRVEQFRTLQTVTEEIDALLKGQSVKQLDALAENVEVKLKSDEPIDVDYWEHLRRSLRTWKAKALTEEMYNRVLSTRLKLFRRRQVLKAYHLKEQLRRRLYRDGMVEDTVICDDFDPPFCNSAPVPFGDDCIKLSLIEFLDGLKKEREAVLAKGYIPLKKPARQPQIAETTTTTDSTDAHSKFSDEAFDRLLNSAENDTEDSFNIEADIILPRPAWADTLTPKKPRFSNRVILGYDWNRYNQVHYDKEHPPPKVVLAYKFNLYYPELANSRVAPTYKIERAKKKPKGGFIGDDETCIIRFIAGPPYEDVAFRIVDKEWDYSSKIQAGFKNSFDKGILQLHFKFKRVYYRK